MKNTCDTKEVSLAATGDHNAFAVLVAKHKTRIYHILYYMLNHEEDTWDILQETFLRAYQALPGLKKHELFTTWLIKIAMNLAINHLKKKERFQKCCARMAENVQNTIESPEQIVERKEIVQKLHDLIAGLPPKQKSVFVLCDIEGYTYKEIAEILKCRPGTVMSRLHYARRFLRERLNPDISQAKTSKRNLL